jgi:hypothetical protein
MGKDVLAPKLLLGSADMHSQAGAWEREDEEETGEWERENSKKSIKNYRRNRDKNGARFVLMQTQAQA